MRNKTIHSTLQEFSDYVVVEAVEENRVNPSSRRLERYDRIVRVFAAGLFWTRGPWVDKPRGIDGYFFSER
jgi:hypothetical protein